MIGYLLMLLSAFGLGAAHALEPGHGKTLVAAFLVGSRGRVRDAVLLGVVVTITHTASIFLLVLTSTVAAAYLVPEQVRHWFAVGSGLLVVGVGLAMIYTRLRSAPPVHAHSHGEHEHGHEHPHAHPHRRTGSVLALGISGGLAPCPAAFLLIPAALGMGAVLKGVLLVVSFSLGLAVVLTAIGIVTLKLAGLTGRWLEKEQWVRRISLASACFITLLGMALTVKAFLPGGGAH